MDVIEAYHAYMNKIGDRKALYAKVVTAYKISSALYPGSHIDITPSFLIPRVIYVDNYRGAIKFFEKMDEISQLIHANKDYADEPEIQFIGTDYTNTINVDAVDMLISQYAGFVGQATKRYLKKGGILLCNDSHGDATLAYLDHDYEFIAIVTSENEIIAEHLDTYFITGKDQGIDRKKVLLEMKAAKYKKEAYNYIFRLK